MLFLLGFLLLVGVTLLVIGLEGKLVDDDPYCTGCRYNLTGLTASRCPECGTAVSCNTVEFGRRVRNKPVLVSAGLVLALVLASGASLLVGEMRGINWYGYHSVAWLLDIADRNTRAVGELTRRLQAGEVTDEDRAQVIDTALAHHTAHPDREPPPVWADLLALLESMNQLSPEQRERYFGSMVPVTVRVRERVVLGDPVVVEYSVLDRGAPSWTYTAHLTLRDLKLAEAAVPQSIPLIEPFDLNARGHSPRHEYHYPSHSPGRFTFSGAVETILYAQNKDPSVDPPAWKHVEPFALDYEVLPEDADDPIALVDRPELAGTIRRALRVDTIHMYCTGSFWPRCRIYEYIGLYREIDVDLAFEVVFELGDEKIDGGYVAWAKGYADWRWVASESFRPVELDRATVVLRGSEEAAALSAGCYQVWSGELRFTGVKVERP